MVKIKIESSSNNRSSRSSPASEMKRRGEEVATTHGLQVTNLPAGGPNKEMDGTSPGGGVYTVFDSTDLRGFESAAVSVSVTAQGSKEELEAMARALKLTERGKIYVKGAFE